MHLKRIFVFIYFALIAATATQAGRPIWSLEALTPTRIEVPSNFWVTVQYQITNHSSKPRTLKMKPVTGITQNTAGVGLCSNVFELSPNGGSCILSLKVNGSDMSSTITDAPVICDVQSGAQCYRPSVAQVIHATKVASITNTTLTMSVSNLLLATQGPAGELTVHNPSPIITATNVRTNISSTGLNNNVTQTPASCDIPPGDDCTFHFQSVTAATFPTPQSITIEGDNTNQLMASIEVEDAVISTSNANFSLQIGTNTDVDVQNDSDVTAENVAFDISGTALDGKVTVSPASCDIPPQDTCTFTLTPGSTAVPAPENFSIKGINTNTIASTMNILSSSTITSVSPNSGIASGGTSITITGTGLSGATAVSVGGVPVLHYKVVNSETITAVTGAHAVGVVDIFVDTPLGDATLTNGYTYVATTLGARAYGGIVASAQGTTHYNLIVHDGDNSTGVKWARSDVLTYNSGGHNGAGMTANTINLVNAAGGDPDPYSAKICADLNVDSMGNNHCNDGNLCYDDWYLPAYYQLQYILLNIGGIGGFDTGAFYWVADEYSSNRTQAWVFRGDGLFSAADFKSYLKRVRCVRNFTL